MTHDLSNKRKDYNSYELSDSTIMDDPFQLFNQWYQEADKKIVDDPNAMVLSTVDRQGRPSSRVVLLKEYSPNGFVFFTDYNSTKGKQIANNPQVALNFFWPALERQIRIEGAANKVSEKTSEEYFNSRPKGSRISAIVSNQSEIIPNRAYLEEKRKELEHELDESKILRPQTWGGYSIKPKFIEFWQGRSNRLHDRIEYKLISEGKWKWNRLSP